MRGDGHHLQMVEERGDLLAAARHAEGDHTAGAVRHVLLRQRMVLVRFEAREAHPADARIGCEPFGHLLRVGAMAFHAYAQRFQVHAHDPGADRRGRGAEVAHELRGGLGDVCGLAEFLRVGDAMVGVVRSGEAREFLRMGHPVEIAGIDDRAAHAGIRGRPCTWWWRA